MGSHTVQLAMNGGRVMKFQESLRCLLVMMLVSSTATVAAPARMAAEVDLSGYWEPLAMEDYEINYLGPVAIDYTGIPLNDEARARALSYSFDQASMVDRACLYYPLSYLAIGPFGFRISAQTNELSGDVVAWRIGPWIDRQETVIWMDGRPRPGPNAIHTASGFSTGAWQHRTLTTYTTHFREGPLRRNGVASSDQASITMRFTRHADYLLVTTLIADPIYLTEPYVLNRLYKLNPNAYLKNDMTFSCLPRSESQVPRGSVPNFLPGKNPFEQDFATRYGVPSEVGLGGAQTMYPEYRHQLAKSYRPPGECKEGLCCGWGDPRNPDNYNRIKPLLCPGQTRINQEVFELQTGRPP